MAHGLSSRRDRTGAARGRRAHRAGHGATLPVRPAVMIRHEIARSVKEAADRARKDGALPDVALPEIVIERPQRPEHGDYATGLPLQLARAARANPIELGKTLARLLPASDAIERVEVAPPGFVNFHLSEAWLAKQVDPI